MASSLRLNAGSMASCVRPGILSTQPLAYNLQFRSFSASQRWEAYRSQNFNPRNASIPSMKARQKDALTTHKPNDLGLLPGTFVRPLWRDMPSIFSDPKGRMHMEWVSMKSWFQGIVSVWQYCREAQLPYQLRSRKQRAKLLYKDLYTALAKGDTAGIRRLCCDGLARDLITQIEGRPKGTTITWNFIRWLRTPGTFFRGVRIMTDRATALPERKNTGIRQLVVRVASRQSIQKSTIDSATKELVPAPAKQQDCYEYLVIQELRWQGEASWRIWGFTQPTDLHAALNDPAFAPGLSMLDRMKAMQGGAGPL